MFLKNFFNTLSKKTTNVPQIYKGLTVVKKQKKFHDTIFIDKTSNVNEEKNDIKKKEKNDKNDDKNDDRLVYIVCEHYML